MKKITHFIIAGIALLTLTACPKNPVVDPNTDSQEENIQNNDNENNKDSSEGTGIDDLHGSQTDKPAYRRQR